LYIERIYTFYIVKIYFDCIYISIKLRLGKIWSICDDDMVFFDKVENIMYAMNKVDNIMYDMNKVYSYIHIKRVGEFNDHKITWLKLYIFDVNFDFFQSTVFIIREYFFSYT